jgi:hypothetical protein
MINKNLIELKENEVLDEKQLNEAFRINDFSGYEKVIESFPEGTFNKGLELFCGRGYTTIFLQSKVRRLTCLDINQECKKAVWRFKNTTFIPIDSLKLVRDHYAEIAYDLVDVDCSMSWDGEGIRRYEFYSLLPELLKMTKSLIVFTFIINPRTKDFQEYLNCFPNYYGGLIKDIKEAREEFFGYEGYITDECLYYTMNKTANKVGKNVKLLLREYRSLLNQSNERIYFRVDEL